MAGRWLRAHSSLHTASVQQIALALYLRALETAIALALPLIAVVTIVGIAMGLAQTVVQIQDQNLSFAPKLIAVALLAVFGAAAALSLLKTLLLNVVMTLPRLAG